MDHTTEYLKTFANRNQFASTVFHLWLKRERQRNYVTINALRLQLSMGHHRGTRAEFVNFMQSLADIGIGTIMRSKFGSIIGLQDIKYTLNSIAEAALKGGSLMVHEPRLRRVVAKVNRRAAKSIPNATERVSEIVLGFMVNGRLIQFKIPDTTTKEDLVTIIHRMKGNAA